MTSKNDITGDIIKTKPLSSAYAEGWDRIFGKEAVLQKMVEENEKLELYDIDYDGCYIDPPSGWMYGFPKQYFVKEHGSFRNLLIQSNYPEKDIDFALSYIRIIVK